jgi:four helix bundle protein
MSQSYRDLEIFKEASDLFFQAHSLTAKLPKYEMYELGSQIRRAADSIGSNIVEGWGRRRYKAEYVRFLLFSHASNMELQYHLEKVARLYPEFALEAWGLRERYDQLGKRIYSYLLYVEKHWIV